MILIYLNITFQLVVLAVAIILLSVSSLPYLLIGAVPVVVIFVWLRQYYVKTAREIKRIESLSKSVCVFMLTLRKELSVRMNNVAKHGHAKPFFNFLPYVHLLRFLENTDKGVRLTYSAGEPDKTFFASPCHCHIVILICPDVRPLGCKCGKAPWSCHQS